MTNPYVFAPSNYGPATNVATEKSQKQPFGDNVKIKVHLQLQTENDQPSQTGQQIVWEKDQIADTGIRQARLEEDPAMHGSASAR